MSKTIGDEEWIEHADEQDQPWLVHRRLPAAMLASDRVR